MNAERRQFFEAFVNLSDEDKGDEVIEFFKKAGLDVVRAKTGLFVSGGADEFEATTGVDLNTVPAETSLPIPEDMRHAIRSINVCPIPDYN